MRDYGKMKKFFLISFFIFSLFIFGSISTLFIYPERTQNFIVETLNLKNFLNKKIKIFISSKINDNNINDDIVFGAVAFVRRGRELFFESVRTHRSFVRDALESERDDVFRDSI